jgi:hypothetical protein
MRPETQVRRIRAEVHGMHLHLKSRGLWGAARICTFGAGTVTRFRRYLQSSQPPLQTISRRA